MGNRVDQHVLRLDVAVADPDAHEVGDRAEHLVGVELDEDVRQHLLLLPVVLKDL